MSPMRCEKFFAYKINCKLCSNSRPKKIHHNIHFKQQVRKGTKLIWDPWMTLPLANPDYMPVCSIKETDNINEYITHVGSHFSLGSTAQPKLFVIS